MTEKAYEDLLIDSSNKFEDGNYFEVTILDLDPGKVYPIQFKWVYSDGTESPEWSGVYDLIIQSESVPGAPAVTANGNTPGMITVSWNGQNIQGASIESTIKQVDIYISGSPFDGLKPALNFDKAGTKTVSAPAGVYTIVAYALTARNTVSTQTTISNVTVTAIAPPVSPPTLPSGLSVATAPFAVSVNWNGSYSASNFDGFKSIDIHVRGSDLGATATSGFSTATQVATLTVNSTTNRQNIGLDNLRQALSLANNQAAYTSPMFFYYIARNANDVLYSVGGTPTYTRINSTTVNPTQANFVDIANGVISIENLVAGNGQFASWMRVGSAGGTRIELSGTNDFSNGGGTVQKGLVAYSSGNTEIFNLDIDAGTLTINGNGTFTGDLSAGSGNSIFKSDSNGIYLGATTFAGAVNTFRVSRSGVMNAASGTIGGLELATNGISNSANTFAIGSTGQLRLGSETVGQPNFLITPTQLVHRTGSSASGKFTLDINTGTLTLGDYATTTQLGTKIGAAEVNANVTSISGGVITTGTINLNNVNVNNGTGNNSIRISSSGLELYNNVGTRTVHLNPSNGSASFTGTITGSTITGGLLRTGSTGARIEISGSDQGTNPHSIVFMNPAGSPTSHIVPLNVGGTQYGLLMHYGPTADQSGGSYPQFYLGSINATMSSRQFAGGPSALVSVDYQLGVTLQTNSTDININGPAKFSSTMFAPNLSTSSSATNLRVTTGTVGEIQETSASSIRFKENIEDLPILGEISAINLLNLPVRSFIYKEGYLSESDDRVQKVLPGFIAEEVEQFYPIAVDYAEGQPHSWNERFIIPGMLALIQNLNQELINIKSRLDALEG